MERAKETCPYYEKIGNLYDLVTVVIREREKNPRESLHSGK